MGNHAVCVLLVFSEKVIMLTEAYKFNKINNLCQIKICVLNFSELFVYNHQVVDLNITAHNQCIFLMELFFEIENYVKSRHPWN